MKSKKIKLIIFHPYSTIGGADKSIARLINGLNEKKYEITFLTISKPYIKNYLNKKIKIIKINTTKTIFSIFKIRNILKTFSKNEKIIFFSNQNFANIISFFILYKFKNIKHVVVERNHIDEFNYYKNIFDYIKKKIIIFLMIILYKKADLVIGNAKKLSHDLSRITKAKVKTIYNPAFDNSIFKLSKKKINFKKNKNIILNVGRLEIQKDQITILKAIKNINNVFLIIIGYGSQKNILIDYIKKNNLGNKVTILEKISNPYPYFIKSKLFVLSSLYEGFPNVLTEALMFNLPVISSNCNSGPSEILLQKRGVQIFNKSDSSDLEKKIKAFFKNKKNILSRKNLLLNGLNRFKKNVIIKKYDKIFSNLFI
tara:strand:+ start:478 stop:1587 length:1110 start_codon:yes stop_codon:yes gene_type:complete